MGSATHDNGFEKDQRNGGITHHIDANVDQERDFLEQSFSGAGVLAGAAYVLPANPLTTAKTATGGSFRIRWPHCRDGSEVNCPGRKAIQKGALVRKWYVPNVMESPTTKTHNAPAEPVSSFAGIATLYRPSSR